MLKNQRIVIIFPIIICLIFSSCRNKEKRIHFSFEKAQKIYYQELVKYESTRFNPFYIDKAFFQKTEQQLNEEIEQSCYCSVLIRSSINNGILEIAAIYDSGNEIWFHLFKHDGSQKRIKIKDPEIKGILKSKPRKAMIINESNHLKDSTNIISDLTRNFENKESERKNRYIILSKYFCFCCSLHFIILKFIQF